MRFVLKGQVRGGKNNIIVTKEGRRFPNPQFKAWATQAHYQLCSQTVQYRYQLPIDSHEYSWVFLYTPEDNRRRDCTAVLDGVMHVLESAKIVTDDRYVSNLSFETTKPDKLNAGIIIDVVKKSQEEPTNGTNK